MNLKDNAGGGRIVVDAGASRPAAILRVAEDLEREGAEILELFEKIGSSRGEVTLPIHYRDGEEECFAEVESEPWDGSASDRVLTVAAALRESRRADARLNLFSAYPAPREVRFLISRAPAALLQLDLVYPDLSRSEPDAPELLAEGFRAAASRHWGVDLDYDPGCLPLVQDLLLAALNEDDRLDHPAPVSRSLVRKLGSYVGEVARRNAKGVGVSGNWRAVARDEEYVLDLPETTLDPIGKARSFLCGGEEDSIARYVEQALGARDPG